MKTFLKHPIRYTKMFKNYAHILRRWSSLSQPAAYYIRKFHYDTALSTGDSTFAGIKEVTDVSHFHFGSDAHFAPDRWIAEMEKILERPIILMKTKTPNLQQKCN